MVGVLADKARVEEEGVQVLQIISHRVPGGGGGEVWGRNGCVKVVGEVLMCGIRLVGGGGAM